MDSTRWGSIGSEYPRVHVLMYTDEHVGEAPINGPPDEMTHGATYVQCTCGVTGFQSLLWTHLVVVHCHMDQGLVQALSRAFSA